VKHNRTKFGAYVRFRRLKTGFTFRQLSRLTGLSATLLFNIESGKRDPK
jgi:transcriptional regulator with XRE-family HTH domain